jgi:hypothetical protein
MITFLLLFCSAIYSQIELPKQTRSAYEGTEFVVSFMQNEVRRLNDRIEVDQKIIISSRFNTSATLTYYDNNNIERNNVYTISPTSSRRIVIPEYYMCNEEGQVRNKNIQIKSTRDISVVCYSSQYTTSDMYSAIPVSRWGNEYQAITHGIDHYDVENYINRTEFVMQPRSGQFLIMANEDNTTVRFTPRGRTKSLEGNQEHTITLNKWQSFLVQSDVSQTKMANDLTGSIIRSDKPIGVLSGHMRTAITPKLFDDFGDSKDHLIEMLNPSNLFGKEYVTAPFGQSIKNYFCLTTIKPNTIVDVLTNEGSQRIFLDFPGARRYIRVDGAAKWTANNNFQLAQFMARYGEDDEECNEFYDPSYVIIQPTEYFNNNLNFLTIGYNESNYGHGGRLSLCGERVENFQYLAHYAMIISKDEARYNTLVDGNNYSVTNYEGTIPGTEYYYGYIKLEPGQHTISTNLGGFQVLLYGRGFYDSYSYSLGGSSIPDSASLLDNSPPEITLIDNCTQLIVNIEDNDDNSTGIQFVDIVDEETYNIKVVELKIDNNNATLIAEQINTKENAQVTFQYFDNAGNGRQYTHTIKGQDLNLQDKNLGIIAIEPDIVYKTSLSNLTENEINIVSISFSNTNFYLQEIFKPFTLNSFEELEIGFLIRDVEPELIPDEVYMIVETDCNLIDSAFIKLQKVNYGFFGRGIDLGEIPLGLNKCGIVYFENSGNIDLTITNINFEESIFQLDTNGLNRAVLSENERIEIETCVQPFDRTINSLTVFATAKGIFGDDNNSRTINLSDQVEVIYFPVGGIFEDKFIDFGNVMINEIQSISLEIENIGDYFSSPTFNNLEIISNDKLSQINDLEFVKIEQNFNPNQKLSIDLTFEPTEIGYYENILTFDYLEGLLPRQFQIRLIGNSFNNLMNGFDNCFQDTLFAFEENESNVFNLFEYQGNVDKILYIIRNYNAYFTNAETGIREQIDYNESDIKIEEINANLPKELTNNEIITGLISFIPTKGGFSELEIIAITSANDVDKLFDSTIITICANSKVPIYPELDILMINNEVWACDTSEILLFVRNTGEVDINVREVEFFSNYHTEFLVQPDLPIDILQGQSLPILINVFRLKDEIEEIEIKVVATDIEGRHSQTISRKHLIEPRYTKLFLPDLDFSYNIGDSSVVNIYGDIPYNIDMPAKLKIRLYTDYRILWLLSESSEIVVTKDGEITRRIPFQVNKNLNDIEFGLDYFEFEINGNERWSIDLLFRVMLSQYLESEIIVEVSYDECFENARKVYPIRLEDVCAQTFRVVEFYDKGDIDFGFDYQKSQLFVNLSIPVSSNYSIYLIDMLGKKYPLEEKKFANNGKYFLNYDLKYFPNGNYFLNIETKFLTERKQIIIIK